MKERITYFEGLRGIAALIVVLNHYALAFYPAIYSKSLTEIHTQYAFENTIYNSPLSILFNGNFAVYIFFILSGIVLTLSYMHHVKKISSLVSVAIKRYFRLIPPVIFCNSIIFVILLLHLTFNEPASKITYSTWWLKAFWQFIPNLADMLIQTFLGIFWMNIPQTYNPVLWVISIFFLGTLLVTGTLALFGKVAKRSLIYVVLIGLLINTYFYPFIVGVLLSELFFRKKTTFKLNKVIMLVLFSLGIYFGSYPIMLSHQQLSRTIFELLPPVHLIDDFGFYHALGATLIIVSLIWSKLFQKILSHRVLVFLGKISYSLYVFHLLIIGTLSSYLLLQFYPARSYNKAFLMMFCITLPIMILASYLIHRFIEKRGEKLGNKFLTYVIK